MTETQEDAVSEPRPDAEHDWRADFTPEYPAPADRSAEDRIDTLRKAIDAAVGGLNEAWSGFGPSEALEAVISDLQRARTNDDIAQGRDWPPVVLSPSAGPERFDRSWWHYADDCPVPPSAGRDRLRERIEAKSGYDEMYNGTGDGRCILLEDLWPLLGLSEETQTTANLLVRCAVSLHYVVCSAPVASEKTAQCLPPAELLGPLGLTVALGLAVAALWRDHQRSDADMRAQRDIAIAGWRAQTDATNRLADELESGRLRAARRQVRNVIDRLLHRSPPEDRVAAYAEVNDLAEDSERTLRRVERLIRLARMDAQIEVQAVKIRARDAR